MEKLLKKYIKDSLKEDVDSLTYMIHGADCVVRYNTKARSNVRIAINVWEMLVFLNSK